MTWGSPRRGAGSNWRKEYRRASSSSIIAAYVKQIIPQLMDKLLMSYLVATPVAIIGGGEYGDNVSVVTPVVALHDQLMRSGDERQSV